MTVKPHHEVIPEIVKYINQSVGVSNILKGEM